MTVHSLVVGKLASSPMEGNGFVKQTDIKNEQTKNKSKCLSLGCGTSISTSLKEMRQNISAKNKT